MDSFPSDLFCQLDQDCQFRPAHRTEPATFHDLGTFELVLSIENRRAGCALRDREDEMRQQEAAARHASKMRTWRWRDALAKIQKWKDLRTPPVRPSPRQLPVAPLVERLAKEWDDRQAARRAARLAIVVAISAAPLSSCSSPSYFPPAYPPVVREVLPYDGPSKVTVIDHGPVPAGIFVRSTPSTTYTSSSYGYSGDSFESPYAWSFPDQSPCYSGSYYRPAYCPPVRRHVDAKPFFPGSDYGYSSYRDATSGSSSRRRSR